jgi:hypothetical protein
MVIKERFASAIEHEQWTGQVREAIWQYLSEEDTKHWHVQFAQKVETVKDFDALYHSFMVGLLEVILPHDKHGVVQPVIDLHKNYKNVTPNDWEKARDAVKAAVDAAWVGGGSAVRAATVSAMLSVAAKAAGDAAKAAVMTAVIARAWIAFRTEDWQKIRDAFLNAEVSDGYARG